MTDEVSQVTNKVGARGRHIDDDVKIEAVRRVRDLQKKKTKGAQTIVANEIGVHPVTISDWMTNPKYSKPSTRGTTKKVSKTGLKSSKTIKMKKAIPQQTDANRTFSLRDAISNLPTTYDGLLREHIKLLMEIHDS